MFHARNTKCTQGIGTYQPIQNRPLSITVTVIGLMLMIVAPNYRACAQVVQLKFDTLPSAQGWIFQSTHNVSETDVFSLARTGLHQNSFGIGDTNAAYILRGAIDPALPFQLAVRARVTDEERPDTTDKFGLTFEVDYGRERFTVGLGKDKIRVQDSSNVAGFVLLDHDNTQFHNYVMIGAPGGRGYTLSVDGTQVFSGQPESGAENLIMLGDATFRPNAVADVMFYRFCQSSENASIGKCEQQITSGDVEVLGELSFAPTSEMVSHAFALQQSGGDAVIWIPDSGGTGLEFKSSVAGPEGNRVTFSPNGNVGIGTSQPQARLDVQGDIRVSGSVFANGQLLGQTGPQGPQGPTGPVGPAGPQGPSGPTQNLNATSVVRTYTGALDANCPSGFIAVAASCQEGHDLVTNGRSSPSNSGAWQSWLTPNPDNSTGVHCSIGPGTRSTAILRCLRLQ